jgi:hypothetical protein
MSHRLPVACVGLALVVSACSDLGVPERIEDLRVLALKTEPPDLTLSTFLLSDEPEFIGLASTGYARVQALVVEPRGGRVHMELRACPKMPSPFASVDFGEALPDGTTGPGVDDNSATPLGCEGFDLEAETAELDEQAAAEFQRTWGSEEREADSLATLDAVGRVPDLVADRFFDPAPLKAMLDEATPEGMAMPLLWPHIEFEIEATSLDHRASEGARYERAFKRLPVLPQLDDPLVAAAWAEGLAGQTGLQPCEDLPADEAQLLAAASQGFDCIVPPRRNQNPAITGWELAPIAPPPGIRVDASPEILRGATIIASPGDVLHLTPTTAPGNALDAIYQTYQVTQSGEWQVNTRIEDPVASYFVTRGQLTTSRTTVWINETLGLSWTLPAEARAGEQDGIVVVVRDQRGGTDFATLTILYE